MNKITITILLASLLINEATCVAQDEVRTRMEIVRQFSIDLQNGKSDKDVFKVYLESNGIFSDQTVAQTAVGWTKLLRESLQKIPAVDIEIYKYFDRPEKGRLLKPIEDPGSGETQYAPLEFELHTKNKTVSVEANDLYVLKLYDENVYVLFNSNNKMITFFGLRWGHKVALMQF